LSAGTATSPRLSVSFLTSVIATKQLQGAGRPGQVRVFRLRGLVATPSIRLRIIRMGVVGREVEISP
jgi:hypothetical protein